MKKKFTAIDLLVYAIIAVPIVYLALNYAAMPATIPIHFGFHGADGYGEKAQSWVFITMISVVSFMMYVFLKYLPSIDPKRTAASSDSLVFKISILIVVFLSLIQVLIINAMLGHLFSIEKILIPVMGIFFSLLGNLMLNMKPNYFVGIRLPWTLESEDNWRKTHHLAGKLWFAGGLFAAILGLLLPYQYALICFLALVSVMVIIPVVFSYRYFKNQQIK